MILKKVGFFKELRHGDKTGPSLVTLQNHLPDDIRKKTISFLHGGSVLATAGVYVDDYFLPEINKKIAPLEVRTDGEWLWSGDLSYYVEHYGVLLPSDFLLHMKRCGYKANSLSHDELVSLAKSNMETD